LQRPTIEAHIVEYLPSKQALENMNKLLDTQSLKPEAITQIWSLVSAVDLPAVDGHVALSFQGSGTRTRTTFLQALSHLGLQFIDLPTFLDTKERAQDLAGYLDPFYSLYIVRYHDHEKMKLFSDASRRPIINAMSSVEHPCEALSDAYWFHTTVKPLDQATIVLWGPITNVLRSWGNVARACGADVKLINEVSGALPENADLVVTDGWPRQHTDRKSTLTKGYLEQMGRPLLLPTPPFTIGQELDFDPLTYANFAGYEQKLCLLEVQKAIIRYALEAPAIS
jgi:ornithine carbamoyltransferase